MWYFRVINLVFLLNFQDDSVALSSHITGRRRYFIGTDKVTGNQAVEMCRRRSMKLASIRNEKENNDIYRFLSQQDLKGGFYVSGKKLSYGGAFTWLDGKPLEFFSWNAGEPNGYLETESCIDVFIVKDVLKWDDQPCEYPGFYLCESMDDPDISIDEDDSCPFKKSKKQKYYLGTEKFTYFDAIQYCEKMFMQLATVKTAEENFEIYTLMLVKGLNGDGYWIAANQRLGSNVWRWLDGTRLKYFNWNDGEPNNDRPRENCITVFRKDMESKWNDDPCEHQYFAICEKVDPKVEIHVNKQLLYSEKRKLYPEQSDVLEIFLDLPENNYLLGWNIVKK
ncbi:macrophage mannose receptor 1 isoform X1 [Leptinotarsa decemlineata]|uniref:macrophage mannose receptor 1 isoform X1 n=2 Tax=Leptinotarsa decemlineata TaxID=7539 RepID=UPI003D30C578